MAVGKLDGSTGDEVWKYQDAGEDSSTEVDFAVNGDGNIIVSRWIKRLGVDGLAL